MPTVTALKPQKNGKRVNVYLDGEFGFGIDLDNLVLSGIKINKFFSDEDIQKIIRKAEFQKTFDKLVNFVMFRPRSEKEVDLWFIRKKVSESIIDELKERIKKLGFLNDENFTKWWIEQRLTFRKKSIRAIKSELAQKGVNRSIVENVIENMEVDESQMATELLQKKSRKWETMDEDTKEQKMSEYLARNGFSWEVVKKAVREYN